MHACIHVAYSHSCRQNFCFFSLLKHALIIIIIIIIDTFIILHIQHISACLLKKNTLVHVLLLSVTSVSEYKIMFNGSKLIRDQLDAFGYKNALDKIDSQVSIIDFDENKNF